MRTTRVGILAVAVLGIAPLLNAQYVRIADVDAIANGVSPPTVLESAFAPYTEEARAHGIEGTVTIEGLINEYSQIRNARILRGLGFGLDEVMDALKQWKFSPGKKDGQDVDVALSIAINFRLQPKQ